MPWQTGQNWQHGLRYLKKQLSLSLSLYIYLFIYICVCVCCVYGLSVASTQSACCISSCLKIRGFCGNVLLNNLKIRFLKIVSLLLGTKSYIETET